MAYACAICGETHEDLPDIGADRPDHWWDVPEDERERRIVLTSDTCVIDDEHFFIRGVLGIPVHDHRAGFGFGVWVSQRRESFETYVANPDSAGIGPYFGWLCTRLGCYEEDTQLLKTMAHFRGEGLRPSIVLEPGPHRLSVEQRDGVTLDRAWEIVHWYDRDA